MVRCPATVTTKVMVTDGSGKDHMVTIFEPTLSKTIEGITGDSLATKLILAPAMKFKVNNRNVVFAIATLTLWLPRFVNIILVCELTSSNLNYYCLLLGPTAL